MSYSEYYGERVVAIHQQANLYTYAAKRLGEYVNPKPSEPKTVLIGGFHPFVNTPSSIEAVCRAIHPGSEIKTLFMDMNWCPVSIFAEKGAKSCVQAKLQDLPLLPEQVDSVVLDYTLGFMEDSVVRQFFQRANRVLKPDGLIFASTDVSLGNFISGLIGKYLNRVEAYPRGHRKLRRLCPPTKLSYLIDAGDDQALAVFSRSDSPYCVHEGEPFGILD